MGTRSAPFVCLLLTACMAADGAPSANRDGGGAAPAPVAAAPAVAVALPAIPRMRPKPPRKPRTAGNQAQTAGSANPGGKQRNGNAASAAASADDAGQENGSGAGAVVATTAPAAPSSGAAVPVPTDGPQAQDGAGPTGAPDVGTAAAAADLPPGSGDALESADPMADTPPPDAAPVSLADDGADLNLAGETDATAFDLALLSPPEPDQGIDVESLFDGDVVRYCAAMWQMGEHIGAARRRGEPFKRAIGEAVRRIADEKQLPLDNRLAFSGQVYGRLVYRLEETHAALTFGTYVHFACLTVRGDKKIVPADPSAERLLNSGLAYCESTAFTRDDLNACIFRELTPVVERRNG